LSRSYIDAIQAFQPDFFLFENVLGLWRTAKHRAFFEELKSYLALSGYVMSQQLINAIQYGVPQDRDRIILFGVKRHLVASSMVEDEGSPGYLATGVIPWPVFTKYPGRTAFDYPWPKTVPFAEDSCLPQPQGIPLELTVEYWFRQNRVSQHANSIRCFRPRATFKRFITIAEGDVSKKSFKRLHRWRYSPTASYGNNEVHIHPYKPRRISAAEALAIQSLPSDFVLPDDMSLSNMFKAIGNGVPFLASRGIARTIRSFLEGLG
jgi:DNA (cytosine-5)-methyltransferase 1